MNVLGRDAGDFVIVEQLGDDDNARKDFAGDWRCERHFYLGLLEFRDEFDTRATQKLNALSVAH